MSRVASGASRERTGSCAGCSDEAASITTAVVAVSLVGNLRAEVGFVGNAVVVDVVVVARVSHAVQVSVLLTGVGSQRAVVTPGVDRGADGVVAADFVTVVIHLRGIVDQGAVVARV